MEANIDNAPYIALQNSASPDARRPLKLKGTLVIIGSIVFLISLVALFNINQNHHLEKMQNNMKPSTIESISQPRGIAEGVSAKSNLFLSAITYNWTNAMLSWQRTAFHFQPQQNWMNGMLSSTIIIKTSQIVRLIEKIYNNKL